MSPHRATRPVTGTEHSPHAGEQAGERPPQTRDNGDDSTTRTPVKGPKFVKREDTCVKMQETPLSFLCECVLLVIKKITTGSTTSVPYLNQKHCSREAEMSSCLILKALVLISVTPHRTGQSFSHSVSRRGRPCVGLTCCDSASSVAGGWSEIGTL